LNVLGVFEAVNWRSLAPRRGRFGSVTDVPKPIVAVNGRFLTMTPTGVQRYAHEILRRLDENLQAELRIIVPPGRILEAHQMDEGVATDADWHGVRGHRWEQLTLPRLTRSAGARVLWSPCNWGPLIVRRQVPVVHDIAPLTHPQYYTRGYRMLARTLTRPLVRRSALVVTPSVRARIDLLERFRLDADRVLVVAPGVGPPFDSMPLDDLERRSGGYCLLVGAHDARKNAGFVLEFWPSVRAETGLELHMTYRSMVTTLRHPVLEGSQSDGIVVHADPTDDELAWLYANALCLLWPSHFEGYGFPLLEAMAVGTPFLSTDVGAAAELAVAPQEQILPLEAELWRARIEAWRSKGVSELRKASARRARSQSWTSSASQTAAILDRLAEAA
jgi:glycosyltransferase involved in cell wall biosynthesis